MLIGQDWSHVLGAGGWVNLSQITPEVREEGFARGQKRRKAGCKASEDTPGQGSGLSLHTTGCLSYVVPFQGGPHWCLLGAIGNLCKPSGAFPLEFGKERDACCLPKRWLV